MSQDSHSVDQDTLSEQCEDTTGVQLIPRYGDDISYPDCLVVAPFRKVKHGQTIMATVEHYKINPNADGFPWTIRPVTVSPLELKVAVGEAMKFAKANGIPIVLLNQDGFSSAAELRQTDTKAIKTGAPALASHIPGREDRLARCEDERADTFQPHCSSSLMASRAFSSPDR